MFKKIRRFLFGPSEGRTGAKESLRQARLARELMYDLGIARELDIRIDLDVRIATSHHSLSIPGGKNSPACKWLYELAAGSWHQAKGEAERRRLMEEADTIAEKGG
jgi:hypothetical protein